MGTTTPPQPHCHFLLDGSAVELSIGYFIFFITLASLETRSVTANFCLCRAKKALFNGFTSLSRKSPIYQYHARDLSRNAVLSRNEHAFLRDMNNFCQPILQFVIVRGTLHDSPQKIFNLQLIQGISVIPSDGFMHCLWYIFHALPIPERFNQSILSLTKN